VTCSFCGRAFQSQRGLNIHSGQMHKPHIHWGDGPAPKKPCAGPGPWPPCPNGNEEDDHAIPELPEDVPQDMDARHEAIWSARRHARATLVSPQWEQWARDLRLEAEATCLAEVEALYTAPARCPNKETHRYATLMALHPGAGFHKALLKADREEELLLSKVPPLTHCMHLHGIPPVGIFEEYSMQLHAFACISHLEYLRNIPFCPMGGRVPTRPSGAVSGIFHIYSTWPGHCHR